MYKVFFNDRTVILTEDFIKSFQSRYGLFYRFRNAEELDELIDFYRHLKKIDTLFIFHDDIEELRNVFRSCFHCIDSAGGLIRNGKGQLLIMRRRDKWDLPKGKLDKDENPRQAALREAEEECGLKGIRIRDQLLSTYHTYTLGEKQVLKKIYWFDMVYTGSEEPVPETREDITEIRWFRPDELAGVCADTYPSVLDVLKYTKFVAL
jgi:8-oxo-dGTP pyrophosphatase MutT (NUDIX family)